jgi:hypothetical protein
MKRSCPPSTPSYKALHRHAEQRPAGPALPCPSRAGFSPAPLRAAVAPLSAEWTRPSARSVLASVPEPSLEAVHSARNRGESVSPASDQQQCTWRCGDAVPFSQRAERGASIGGSDLQPQRRPAMSDRTATTSAPAMRSSTTTTSVHCPNCARDYARDELEVLDWSYGRPLAARGGQRWVCPGGHTVSAHLRWFS